jgi:hypothetical protein
MSFTSFGKHQLCFKAEKFNDPDCAVELNVEERKRGKKREVLLDLSSFVILFLYNDLRTSYWCIYLVI